MSQILDQHTDESTPEESRPGEAGHPAPGAPRPEVEVRRHAGLTAFVAIAASTVAIAYLTRAINHGGGAAGILDWAVAALFGVVALSQLLAVVDSRTPLLVADEFGVRMRLGREWRGLPWHEVARVVVEPSASPLRDGRLVVEPANPDSALDGLDGGARRQVRWSRRWYGDALVTPLGMATTTSSTDLAGDLAALAGDQCQVVEMASAERHTPPLRREEYDAEGHRVTESASSRTAAAVFEPLEPRRPVEDVEPFESFESFPEADEPRATQAVVDPQVDTEIDDVAPADAVPGTAMESEPDTIAHTEADTEDDAETRTGTARRPRRSLRTLVAAALAGTGRSRKPVDVEDEVDEAPVDHAPPPSDAWDEDSEETVALDLHELRDHWRRQIFAEEPEVSAGHADEPVDEPVREPVDEIDDLEDTAEHPAVAAYEQVEPLRPSRPAARIDVTLPASAAESLRARREEQAGDTRTPEDEDAAFSVPAPRQPTPAIIDDYAAEPGFAPVANPVIGPRIRAARDLLGMSMERLGQRTRIRPHVLEAIEVDDFGACGGDFYARGHLRNISRELGLDSSELLALYEEHYARGPIKAKQVFEAELATSVGSGIRSTSGDGPRWSLMVVAVLALVLVWSLARILAPNAAPITSPIPTDGPRAGLAANHTPFTAQQTMPRVLIVHASSLRGSLVVVHDRTGNRLMKGYVAPGAARRLKGMAPFTVKALHGVDVSVSVDGVMKGTLSQADSPATRTVR